jgi:hypothetical protein
MLDRPGYLSRIATALSRSPVTALLGPRQCGKTTLARMFGAGTSATFFDLESIPDQRRLENPERMLGSLEGLVVLDEIQVLPQLFSTLRVLVDRPENRARFLILGSATPALVRGASESLAGRVEFVELAGFDLTETGSAAWETLWMRGGFPRSFLAADEEGSGAWREGFLRTFLERDIPALGITIPAAALRRFWTMLAHLHGRHWNASELAGSMGLSDKTVRGYLDLLTGTFMVRQLQPWHENISKRQIKSPKIYLRDTGILHRLLDIPDLHTLHGHPRVGASWEGFVIDQVLSIARPDQAYFWGTQGGAELDLFFSLGGRRIGVEVKSSEAPKITRSMRIAMADLRLDRLFIVCPCKKGYEADGRITVLPVQELERLPAQAAQAER